VLSTARRATAGEVAALAGAARLALGAAGPLPPGAVVAVAAPNGPGMLASLLAVRQADCAALLLDEQAPPAEARRVARALGASALLRCTAAWPAAAGGWQAARLDDAGSDRALLLPGIAVVKLTSGTTGEPRGIAATAESLVADDAALARSMGLRAGDRLLAAIPMSHSYGLSSLALPALMRGTPLVMPEDRGLLGPFAAAERLGATVLPTVPAYLDALLRLSQAPARPSRLRLVITAGAVLPARTAAGFRELYGLPVHVFYGASECGGICYDREGGAAERGTVGTPVEGVAIELQAAAGAGVAPEEDAPSTGESGGRIGQDGGGVVTVRSAAVAAGYLPAGDPRLAGGRFVAGDLALWRHGELVLLGRQDGLVNLKGKKVNPREVESVLAALAGVDEVVVLGVPVPESAGEVLRAVIACRPGGLRREEVLAWCRDRLAAHKVPRSLILVQELPRNARGKIDRPALLALRGPADGVGLGGGGAAGAAGDETEDAATALTGAAK
jgi:long-chain acyl-CoA synthetase